MASNLVVAIESRITASDDRENMFRENPDIVEFLQWMVRNIDQNFLEQ